jgi:hypothetical protein
VRSDDRVTSAQDGKRGTECRLANIQQVDESTRTAVREAVAAAGAAILPGLPSQDLVQTRVVRFVEHQPDRSVVTLELFGACARATRTWTSRTHACRPS